MYILVPVKEFYPEDCFIEDEYVSDITYLQQIDQPVYLISEDYVQSSVQFNVKVNGSDYIYLPYNSNYAYLEDCVGFLYNTGTESYQYAIQPHSGELYTRLDDEKDVVRIDYHPSLWYPIHSLESLYNIETEYLEDTSGDGEFPYTVHSRETGEVTGFIYSEY